ncbi:hypothetical protein ACLEDI_00675 [Lonsdalea quercina]|uniref:hypothetical protein n=1 Tax=Lonsdalea quercina TaxID=71657 RepID=UPI00397718A7
MKKRIIFPIIFSTITFSAFARDLLPAEATAVELAVRQEMKDPDAAKFYHWDFPETDKNSAYCGLVNGKNSYGAYSGKQLFFVFIIKKDEGKYGAMPMDTDTSTGEPLSQDIVAASCAGVGYEIKVKKRFLNTVNKSRAKNGLHPLPSHLAY